MSLQPSMTLIATTWLRCLRKWNSKKMENLNSNLIHKNHNTMLESVHHTNTSSTYKYELIKYRKFTTQPSIFVSFILFVYAMFMFNEFSYVVMYSCLDSGKNRFCLWSKNSWRIEKTIAMHHRRSFKRTVKRLMLDLRWPGPVHWTGAPVLRSFRIFRKLPVQEAHHVGQVFSCHEAESVLCFSHRVKDQVIQLS